MKLTSKKLRDTKEDMTRILDVSNWRQDLVLVHQKSFGGEHKIQDRWENVSYVVMEKSYPDLPVYRVRSSKHDNTPKGLHQNLLFPLLSVQPSKPELDQEKS